MKIYFLITLFVGLTTISEAQTFVELFKQKKTQKKYLIAQITALKMYAGYLQKGYSIVRKGLQTIENIKNGELSLHTGFFNSFEGINPNIKDYARTKDIMQLQTEIVRRYNRTFKQLSHHGSFNKQERDYIHKVFNRLLDDGLATINALMMVITPGKLEMNDADRLERIDKLYKNLEEQYIFSKKFNHEINWIAAYREKVKRDAKTGYTLYGLKKDKP